MNHEEFCDLKDSVENAARLSQILAAKDDLHVRACLFSKGSFSVDIVNDLDEIRQELERYLERRRNDLKAAGYTGDLSEVDFD